MTVSGQAEVDPVLRQFVDWARSTGWRYHMAPSYLAHFARFLEQRGVREVCDIDIPLLLAY
ncbi:hypothetical protein ACFL6C_06765, partial [Myxococcota bacterium]